MLGERPRIDHALRIVVLAVLVGAPLALAGSPAPIFTALITICAVVGLTAYLVFLRRPDAPPPAPGRTILILYVCLVVCQLIPLPAPLLKLLSPGSHAFRDELSLIGIEGWYPVTVSPIDTLRGLAALVSLILLYLGVHSLFNGIRLRKRLAFTVVVAGSLLTLIALVQAASSHPNRFYGIWRYHADWAIFGPYTNRAYFANYLAMAIPLALGFVVESFEDLKRAWGRRHPSWLALGDAEGTRALKWTAVAMTLFVGIVAAASRGGTLALIAGLLIFFLAYRAWRLVIAASGLVLILALVFVDIGPLLRSFEARGIGHYRFGLWSDAIRLFPRFPLFGAGFNSFSTLYPRYQSFDPATWFGAILNEYLQVLIDTGLIGAALAVAALFILFRRAARNTGHNAFQSSLLAALAAFCSHSVVDCNLQAPANAVAFVALCGIALARHDRDDLPARKRSRSSRHYVSRQQRLDAPANRTIE
jgi:O-antigen ligase